MSHFFQQLHSSVSSTSVSSTSISQFPQFFSDWDEDDDDASAPQWSPISTISADEFLQHVAEEIELPNIMEDPEIEVECNLNDLLVSTYNLHGTCIY